jgi:hypothetical protein
MHLRFAVLAAVAAAAAPRALVGQTFPYKAYITPGEVYVRSGPGERYYPTGKLQAGAEVEVYRHGPDGWYAIRPPKGSFSWVDARYLKPRPEGLAEVTGDRVAARVGSEFSDIRDVIQVRLDRGETVEVLGTKSMGSGDSATMWYKTAPPSGEFRWVHGKYVDPNPPRGGIGKRATETLSVTQPGKGGAAVAGKASEALAPKWTPAGGSSVSAGATAPIAQAGLGKEVSRPSPSPPPRRLTEEEFQAELDDINAQLSIMLAEEATVWNCEELNRRSKALFDQAETAFQRGSIRVLVNRIAQSEDIKRRYAAINGVRSEIDRSDHPWADLARTHTSGSRPPSPEEQFDGVGRLTRVLPPKLGAPRYALLDDQGNVLMYVSPAPGLNMQYYLGRRVGINGVRGYIAQENAEHLTARQVTMLDSRLR